MATEPETQKNLKLKITTPLGADAVILDKFDGVEEISQPFEYTLALRSKKIDLDFDNIIGKDIHITLELSKGKRYFSGIVGEMRQTHISGTKKEPIAHYEAKVYPRFWLLKLNRDHRIFQNKSALDIIKEVLKEHKLTKIEDKTASAGKKKRDYCVQYGESAFDFTSRLMEEEGIFYFFKHTASEHTLVMADKNSIAEDSIKKSVELIHSESIPQLNRVQMLNHQRQAVATKASLADYNYEHPKTKLFSKAEGKGEGGDVYHYPGDYAKSDEGQTLSDVRLEEHEWLKDVVDGRSTAPLFSPGVKYKQDKHPRSDLNKSYFILRTEHHINQIAQPGEQVYQNSFKAIPLDVPYRPLQLTSKPKIYGNQTAIVTGKQGEEIWTDEYGRIKVKFYWDQRGKEDDKSSCWIRVAQMWSAGGWGSVFTPRIGMEVVVTFLEGNPDRPLVTGCVYNGNNMPPYLPDEPTKSTMKSNSSKGGKGYNELCFEDLKDHEEVFMHAQKDMSIEIEDALTTTVQAGDDVKKLEEGSQILVIETGHREKFLNQGNETVRIKGERSVKIDKKEERTNGDTFTQEVEKEYYLGAAQVTIKVSGPVLIDAEGDINVKSKKNISMEAQGNMNFKAMGNIQMQATGTLDMKSTAVMTMKSAAAMELNSAAAFKATAGAAANIQAGAALNLQGGGPAVLQSNAVTAIKGQAVAIG